MGESHQNGILDRAVESAQEKLAAKGVEGCTTKEVILATFGTSTAREELSLLSKEIKKFGWRVISISLTAMLSILLAVILL